MCTTNLCSKGCYIRELPGCYIFFTFFMLAQPTEMFSEPVTTETTYHSADSIETIARSLSRNIHSSEVIDSRRARGDSFSALGLDEADSVFNSGEYHT